MSTAKENLKKAHTARVRANAAAKEFAAGEHSYDIAERMFTAKKIEGFPIGKRISQALARTGSGVTGSKVQIRYQALENLALLLRQTPVGNVAECGVWRGASARIILEMANHLGRNENGSGMYLFDTFGGFGDYTPMDYVVSLVEDFQVRSEIGRNIFTETSVETLRENLADFPEVQIIKGPVEETLSAQSDDLRFSFVHIDLDLYEPTRVALEYFVPRMVDGGIIVCDDYSSEMFPGARYAWDEYFGGRKMPFTILASLQSVWCNS
ncbi:MAG: TylF/MycF family methyltransferase [Alphaproteobacteria bacterium]|nr:TylF/MycF family methyltransferase [Alphaproteobacteria bacterium]